MLCVLQRSKSQCRWSRDKWPNKQRKTHWRLQSGIYGVGKQTKDWIVVCSWSPDTHVSSGHNVHTHKIQPFQILRVKFSYMWADKKTKEKTRENHREAVAYKENQQGVEFNIEYLVKKLRRNGWWSKNMGEEDEESRLLTIILSLATLVLLLVILAIKTAA